MDSSFDDTVVDLSSGGGEERCIKITSSILFFFGEILGMTFGIDGN